MRRADGRRGILAALCALGASVLVAGCGKTGPLYFPEDEEQPKKKPTAARTAPYPKV